MDSMKRLWFLALAPLLWTGCVTNTITNLTPSQHFRTENGLYPVEFAWDSNQQSLKDWTVTPYVVTGFQAYEMKPQYGIENRWEAYIPVPASQDSLSYHIKVDYEYNRMGSKPGRGSKLSRIYTLKIIDE